MNKQDYQERIRKIKWATEHQSGKKMGKKELGKAQQIVMEMLQTPTTEPKDSGKISWRGGSQEVNSMSSLVDLTKIVGKKL